MCETGFCLLSSLRIYYNRGECTELYTSRTSECDEVHEIISRLEVVTGGCKVRKTFAL